VENGNGGRRSRTGQQVDVVLLYSASFSRFNRSRSIGVEHRFIIFGESNERIPARAGFDLRSAGNREFLVETLFPEAARIRQEFWRIERIERSQEIVAP